MPKSRTTGAFNFTLFRGRARCSVCHTFNDAFPFFTNRTYRNTGVSGNSAAFEPLAVQARELTPP